MSDDRRLIADLTLARATVDRAAQFRGDEEWQSSRRMNPTSKALQVAQGAVLVSDDDTLAFTRTIDVAAGVPLTFLGLQDDVAYFAMHGLDDLERAETEGASWNDLRVIGSRLGDRDAGLAVTAIALDNWSRTHQRCPQCGEPTQMAEAGWSRRCPADGSSHFPRTDPAIIVLVIDRHDRALLGRQGRWERGWMSTLAGFVESGESAEAALRREVLEEAGVRIGSRESDIAYLGSQPWPFPNSLMLGYHAWTDDVDAVPDGEEIVEVRWYSRDEMRQACESGDLLLPPQVSIARKLIERWYGSALPGNWGR